jgi:hypothetical protein
MLIYTFIERLVPSAPAQLPCKYYRDASLFSLCAVHNMLQFILMLCVYMMCAGQNICDRRRHGALCDNHNKIMLFHASSLLQWRLWENNTRRTHLGAIHKTPFHLVGFVNFILCTGTPDFISWIYMRSCFLDLRIAFVSNFFSLRAIFRFESLPEAGI